MKRKALILLLVAAFAALVTLALPGCLSEIFGDLFDTGHQHDYELVETVEATCTSFGYEKYVCKGCGKEKYDNTKEALGHDWQRDEYTAPTCTSEGFESKHCARCNEHRSGALDMLPHDVDPEEEGLDPTCTEEGYQPAGTCRVCHNHVDRIPIPAIGHKFKEGACEICGDIQTLVVTYHADAKDGATFTVTYKYGDMFDPDANFPDPPDDKLVVGWYLYDMTFNKVLDQAYTASTKITSEVHVCAKWVELKTITTADELLAIKDKPDIAYKLGKDIVLNGATWTPVSKFTGILDGDGHSIKNFVVSDEKAAASYAMFVNNTGTIKNLELVDVMYAVTYNGSGSAMQGLLVAENNGEISNCKITSGVMGVSGTHMNTQESYRFGTIAALNRGIVKDCSCEVDIRFSLLKAGYDKAGNGGTGDYEYTANLYVGGLLGVNSGKVSGSHFAGNFTIDSIETCGYVYSTMFGYLPSHTLYGYFYIGGLIGGQLGGSATKCYADMNYVHSSSVKYWYQASAGLHRDGVVSYEYSNVGGLVGINSSKGEISYSFANGDIYNNSYDTSTVGGLVAVNNGNASIISCHSSAKVKTSAQNNTKNVTGGLVGTNGAGVQDSYASGEVNGGKNGSAGGLAGENTAQGMISKCYSTGNVFAQSGNGDFFVGSSAGNIYKCYYLKGAIAQLNGAYLTAAKNGSPMTYGELWTDEFLIEDMYWDQSGWIIVLNGDPMLEWEKDVGHTYQEHVVPPTCEDFGYTIYECSDCGKMFIRDYVAPNGHEKSSLASTRAAACEQTGANIWHCNNCGKNFEEETAPALEHQWITDPECPYVAPTCKHEGDDYITTPGHTARIKCSVCGEIKEESQTIEPHEFELIKGEQTTAPACTEAGNNHYVCKNCGFAKDVTVPATGHTLKTGSINCAVCNRPVWDDVNKFTKINSVDGLLNIKNDLAGFYMLTGDIDLAALKDAKDPSKNRVWTPIGTESQPFRGVLYGNGFKIKNLELTNLADGGLFAYNEGTLINVIVENATVSVTDLTQSRSGVIAAVNLANGQIIDCKVTGKVTFAITDNVTTNSFNDNTAARSAIMGGIAAENRADGVVDGCTVDAAIAVTVLSNFTNIAEVDLSFYVSRGWKQGVSTFASSITVGGIVGSNSGKVTGCTMSGSLNADVTQQIFIERVKNEGKWNEVRYKAGKMSLVTNVYEGSLVGNNQGEVSGCKGKVSTLNKVGGTQDDSSMLFAMSHSLNRVSDTPAQISWLIANSSAGTYSDIELIV